MSTPELPPLHQYGAIFIGPEGQRSPVAYYAYSVEARERILLDRIRELEADAARLNYIERTFAGCTTQDRYLPIRMIWGRGCNGRTLREACDKYMARDAAVDAARGAP